MVSCHEGEPHQIATGTPLDTSHNCPYKSLADILLPCLVSPEHTLRSHVCWTCAGCHQTYRGTSSTCPKDSCKGNSREFTSYNGVARRFVAIISGKAALSAPIWSQKGAGHPKVLSPTKLCEVLLTPHGNKLSGMQDGAWTLLEDEGKCSCHSALPPSSSPFPDASHPPELLSNTSCPMDIQDEENNSPSPVFSSWDIREKAKLGIKLTLKKRKKVKKAKKSKEESSEPPTTPPAPSKPSCQPKLAPPPAPNSTSPPGSNPAPPTASKPTVPPNLPTFPPPFNPAVPPPFLRRPNGLLPTPNFPPNIHANSHLTQYDPAIGGTLGDNEPSSESKGNPESWGLWWCWIGLCGQVNRLPQDWCAHCGHSKHAKKGNVHLNRILKRKYSEISGGPD